MRIWLGPVFCMSFNGMTWIIWNGIAWIWKCSLMWVMHICWQFTCSRLIQSQKSVPFLIALSLSLPPSIIVPMFGEFVFHCQSHTWLVCECPCAAQRVSTLSPLPSVESAYTPTCINTERWRKQSDRSLAYDAMKILKWYTVSNSTASQ